MTKYIHCISNFQEIIKNDKGWEVLDVKCLGCGNIMRWPKGESRRTQKCANCRGIESKPIQKCKKFIHQRNE